MAEPGPWPSRNRTRSPAPWPAGRGLTTSGHGPGLSEITLTNRPKLDMNVTPSQILDTCRAHTTDLRHANRYETDMIMAQIRKECSYSPLVMFRS